MLEKIKIKNSKGQNLRAVVHGSDVKTDKLAILCPGFLDTKDYDHLIELGKELVFLGYTVVRFDPTGTWESEGDISEYLTSQYLKDIKSVLEYMLKEKNYTSILLGGHSRGGMVTLLYAAMDPRISVVLAIMPSQGQYVRKDKGEWEKVGFKVSGRDIPGSNEEKIFKLPYQHIIDRNKFDVFKTVKDINVPIIFVAAELDKMCPPEEVKSLYDQANEPKKFILMKNIGHDYRKNLSEIKLVDDEIINCLKML